MNIIYADYELSFFRVLFFPRKRTRFSNMDKILANVFNTRDLNTVRTLKTVLSMELNRVTRNTQIPTSYPIWGKSFSKYCTFDLKNYQFK